MYDVPFVKVDCAQMVSSGYIGSNIEDALTLLYLKARTKFDAENGVVFFDEFDKISEQNTNKGNVGGVALQQEFLKPFLPCSLIFEVLPLSAAVQQVFPVLLELLSSSLQVSARLQVLNQADSVEIQSAAQSQKVSQIQQALQISTLLPISRQLFQKLQKSSRT